MALRVIAGGMAATSCRIVSFNCSIVPGRRASYVIFINKRIFCVLWFLLTFKMWELFLPHPVPLPQVGIRKLLIQLDLVTFYLTRPSLVQNANSRMSGWIMNKYGENVEGYRSWPNVKYYIDILLEGLIITTEKFSHERRYVGWDLNPGLPKTMQVCCPFHSDDMYNGLCICLYYLNGYKL